MDTLTTLSLLLFSIYGQLAPLNSVFEKKPAVNHPPVMKSNTVTRFKIISGLWNNAIYRITGRNKQFEEGY
jgi:hypothetical protein